MKNSYPWVFLSNQAFKAFKPFRQKLDTFFPLYPKFESQISAIGLKNVL